MYTLQNAVKLTWTWTMKKANDATHRHSRLHMYLAWGFENQNNNLVLDCLSVRFAWLNLANHTFSNTRTHTHARTHIPSALAENHSTCLAGLPVATEEQKQAANEASASVQESCHCMHCNELLITPSVSGASRKLTTLFCVWETVCFLFSTCPWCNCVI